MINKDYLDHLKKTAPMAYYDLTQDPMVVSESDRDGCGCQMVLIASIIIWVIIIVCVWDYF